MKNKSSVVNQQISRRKILKLATGGLLGIPLLGLIGCQSLRSGMPPPPPHGFDGAFPKGGPGMPAPHGKGGKPPIRKPVVGKATDKARWATGGTHAMDKTILYQNPLLKDDLGSICQVTNRTTEGPCYSSTRVRQDISEGREGLPVRLWFKIVDVNCHPIQGVKVDIWHCDPFGIYSGKDMEMVDFCTNSDKEYQSNDWFRGIQTTDENGLVYFETCFPGWYVSRAVHIHLSISKGSDTLTTQVGFDDDLADSILLNEAVYSGHGKPDTNNSSDTVFPNVGYEAFLMQTKALVDNSMLAWKALSVDF
ncbi:intradiol ring-cleavage dioxygenase [Marinomonas rhizomae]|uniref:Protocatechuate 3,4-dioxygenase beta subunit n=1 Tax=Marinomonas rhizomae TaxID=491948 RepID=A0A366JFH9_9GAMM|nr:intradiol ring-cleavage dioxygenase [Marinomonas rhizomae]RBP85736.1 protocatechuate 3,4-dioxygenase beta subunit [Marinomonas rhizomae]RNF75642.1 intradiol ring-cleavage dioxygenase [Marinomonas rhizomae]